MEKLIDQFIKFLSGGDLRSIGDSKFIIPKIKNQNDFDFLFAFLFQNDRILAMRAADSIEKITQTHPEYLDKHKYQILDLCQSAVNKELKWHLAQMVPRLPLNAKELNAAWGLLTTWALDTSNSKIVRVNSIQSLYEIYQRNPQFFKKLVTLLQKIDQEGIPSFRARIKRINAQLGTPIKKPGPMKANITTHNY